MRSSSCLLLVSSLALLSCLLCVSVSVVSAADPYNPYPSTTNPENGSADYPNPTKPPAPWNSATNPRPNRINVPTPIGPQYISGTIVWALLVALMLLFVLYIGVGCIMDVERPVRLSAVPLQMGKEY